MCRVGQLCARHPACENIFEDIKHYINPGKNMTVPRAGADNKGPAPEGVVTKAVMGKPEGGPFDKIWAKMDNEDFCIPEGRTIYLSRHGESEYNCVNRMGGNPPLTARGQSYARSLGRYFEFAGISDLKVVTSELTRTIETAEHLPHPQTRTSTLNEIDSGKFDGWTYKEVEKLHPEEHLARKKDKLNYKYPEGESYIDLCKRIEPFLEELEQTEDTVLVVAHQAVLRCFLTYFLREEMEELPFVKIPQHCLIRVTYMNGENVLDFIRTPVE